MKNTIKKAKNVVVIMTDQQRAEYCKRDGYPVDLCPFQDKLARDGVWFSRAYTTSPLCGPARASMLTGRYPSATGVQVNDTVSDAYFDKDIFDVFNNAGFKTAMVGKNHSHLTSEKTDYWYEVCHNGAITTEGRTEQEEQYDSYLADLCHKVEYGATEFPLECQLAYRTVSRASEWISSLDDDENFLMWLSFDGPHNPYQVPEPYYSMFPEEFLPPVRAGKEVLENKSFKWQWTRHVGEQVHSDYEQQVKNVRQIYHGAIRMIDDQVKRFVDNLDELGLREDTLIVYCSDHGDFVGEYGLLRKGPEMPEALMRIPMIINGPGITGESNRDEFASLADILPTVCDAADMEHPFAVQGKSLWPNISGNDVNDNVFDIAYGEQGMGGAHYTWDDNPTHEDCRLRTTFNELNKYTMSGSMRMIRKGDLKLIMDMDGNGQLYNLADDPAEINNLYNNEETSGQQSELEHELLKQMLQKQDTLPNRNAGVKM